MKPYGINYISPDIEIGDRYTKGDQKKNPNRSPRRSYSSSTSKRVLKSAKAKERRANKLQQ